MKLRLIASLVVVIGLATISHVSAGDDGLAKLTGSDTPLKPGTSIAFYGDSITMQGGFINQIEKAIAGSETTKKLGIKLHRHGLNGGRVPTVLAGQSPWGKLGGKMQELIDKDQAKVVVIHLGINDVWHGKNGTTKAEYESGLKKMTAMATKSGAAVILCTPSVIGEETDGKNEMNKKLGEYAGIVRRIAKDEKLTLCDVHQAFVDRLAEVNKANKHQGNLTYDGVHMNDAGNSMLADLVADGIYGALAK